MPSYHLGDITEATIAAFVAGAEVTNGMFIVYCCVAVHSPPHIHLIVAF